MKYSTLMYYLASQRLQCYFNLMVTDYKPKFNFITGFIHIIYVWGIRNLE